jgi:hypothetical protein
MLNQPLFTTRHLTKAMHALTLGSILATGAYAQEAAVTPKNSDENVKKLKTVVVTADTESPSSQLEYLNKENDSGAFLHHSSG